MHGDGLADSTSAATTVVYAHAVIGRLLSDEFLLTLKHRAEGWHVLPGGVIQCGENVREGLRARVREALGLEVGDLRFHAAIEGSPGASAMRCGWCSTPRWSAARAPRSSVAAPSGHRSQPRRTRHPHHTNTTSNATHHAERAAPNNHLTRPPRASDQPTGSPSTYPKLVQHQPLTARLRTWPRRPGCAYRAPGQPPSPRRRDGRSRAASSRASGARSR
jgi:hypothetical protein